MEETMYFSEHNVFHRERFVKYSNYAVVIGYFRQIWIKMYGGKLFMTL